MGSAATSKTVTVLAANLAALMRATPSLDSQAKLGKMCKIDQRTVGRILNRENAPTISQLDKFARAFNLEPWQLLVPNLQPTNPPMVVADSEQMKALMRNIGSTQEAISGFLRDQGNTRPGELDP